MEKVRTLFIGTSGFAVPALEMLAQHELVELVGVVTQPDRPSGREQEISKPAVKSAFEKLDLDISLFQPEKIKENAEEILEKTKPELIIVASYGQILPASIINYPKYKCLNIHGSLLPDLRGAVPIPMAILKGYEETGVSIPVMTEGLDDGAVITSAKIEIEESWTTEDLTQKLGELGADTLKKIFPDWIAGEIDPIAQDESKATYCYMKDIVKENAEIDFTKSAVEIDRMVRAYFPWPVAWMKSEVNGAEKRIKIYKARIASEELGSEQKSGEIFKNEKRLFLKCSDGALEILSIQVEGKKVSGFEDYSYLAKR